MSRGSARATGVEGLTRRQFLAVRFIAAGLTPKEIAVRVGIGEQSVHHWLRDAKDAMECATVGEMMKALEHVYGTYDGGPEW